MVKKLGFNTLLSDMQLTDFVCSVNINSSFHFSVFYWSLWWSIRENI